MERGNGHVNSKSLKGLQGNEYKKDKMKTLSNQNVRSQRQSLASNKRKMINAVQQEDTIRLSAGLSEETLQATVGRMIYSKY